MSLLFPVKVESRPYYVKLLLRFYDDDSQLAVVVYPGGNSEIIRSSLDGMNGSDLYRFVEQTLAHNPMMDAAKIGAKLKVRTTRFPVQYKALKPSLNDLKTIRISPFLGTRIPVDKVTLYEFWFYSGQESVHYKILGDSTLGDTQDQLAQWMTKFRSDWKRLVTQSPE